VEEFDLESAFDDTDGEDLIEVSGNFFFGFYAEALEAVVGLVIGPEVSCSDLADVVIAIRAFFDAVGSSGEALFSGGVCGAAGVLEDDTLPNACDFFSEDAEEAT